MLRVEQSKRTWTCYHCERKFEKKSWRARMWAHDKSRTYCTECMVKATVELIKNNGFNISEEDLKTIKPYYVEVTL